MRQFAAGTADARSIPARCPSNTMTEHPMRIQRICCTRISRLPYISLFLCLASFLVCSGNAEYLLQFDRTAVGGGQIWRVVTGHLTHWSLDHLVWCILALGFLGAACERLCRSGYLATVAAAALAIPLVIWVVEPGMQYYRGLSGIASAVFVFAAVLVMRTTLQRRQWRGFAPAAAAGAAYCGKILFEFISGQTLFVDSQGLFTPAALAHVAGGVVGVIMAFLFRPGQSGPRSSSRSPVQKNALARMYIK